MGAYAAAVKVAAHMDAVDAVEKAEHIFSHLQAQASTSPSASP